jgi:pilus assembly protein Flp/PilA
VRFRIGEPTARGYGPRQLLPGILARQFSQDHADHSPPPRGESGATAIEYGLIAAGIALAIIAVVNNLGSTLNKKFSAISTSLN